MLLMALPDEAATQILKQFAEHELKLIAAEISKIRGVKKDDLEVVYSEFMGVVAQGPLYAASGSEFAKRLFEAAFGPESAEELLPAPSNELAFDEKDPLGTSDPRELALFLASEHPQTIAVVLSHLDRDRAVNVMRELPEKLQAKVGLRMASLGRVSSDAVEKISEAIAQRMKSAERVSRPDGVKTLARMLSRMESDSAETLLEQISSEDETVAKSVRDQIFVFTDLTRLDRTAIQALLGKVDRRTLMIALKGEVRIRKLFLQCMSRNAGDILLEDMEALGPVRVRDRKAAQQQIVAAVRELQEAGILSLTRGGDNDFVE